MYENMRRHGGSRSRILNSGWTRRVMKMGALWRGNERPAVPRKWDGSLPFCVGLSRGGRGWFALTAGGRAWGV